jgi:hypothetical protein
MIRGDPSRVRRGGAAMRRIRFLIAAVAIGAGGLLGTPVPAQAFTCNLENPYIDDNGLVCTVAYTMSGPVCHKYGCM